MCRSGEWQFHAFSVLQLWCTKVTRNADLILSAPAHTGETPPPLPVQWSEVTPSVVVCGVFDSFTK